MADQAELERALGMYLGRHPGLVDKLAADVWAHASGGLALPVAKTGNRKWLFARVEAVARKGRLGMSRAPVVAEARDTEEWDVTARMEQEEQQRKQVDWLDRQEQKVRIRDAKRRTRQPPSY